MTVRIRTAFLLLLAVAGLVACSRSPAPDKPSAAPATPLRKVRLQTDWFPQAEHGGFYQALARGFYREAGLDVELLPGGPGANIKPKVINRDVEFGINPSTDVIVAASRGMPLLIVGAFLQHDHQALLLHAENPIESFAQLDGQTVIAAPSLVWIRFLQRKYGITFNILPVPYGLANFFANPQAIQQCVVTNEPFLAAQHGVRVKTLRIADAGYDPYHVIFCRPDFAAAQPEIVRAFVAASVRGWRDYIEGDPAPADALILKQNPRMTAAFLAFSRRELTERRLVTGDPAKGEGAGRLALPRIEASIAQLVALQVLEQPLAVAKVATTEFLPAETK
ncbi:MAG: ABC transporter substrate-binding protein [Opitutae bacterium]|nr:ABC transporter substrate-binding protein [Opitutae bacterium]